MKKKKDSKHSNSSSKPSSRNKTTPSTAPLASTVPLQPSQSTTSSSDKHTDSGVAYSTPIAKPDAAFSKPNTPPPSNVDTKVKDSARLKEDLNVLQTGLLASDAPENEVVKLLAAGKIRQLLVSDNAALIDEILRCDWVPRLLRWLQPLPTALPPFYSSRRGAVPVPLSTLPSTTDNNSCHDLDSNKTTSNINTNNGSNSTGVDSPSNTTTTCGDNSGCVIPHITGADAAVMPVSKKRKSHEVTSQSEDSSDISEHTEVVVPSSDLETLRHQRLHLQIGALWALTNLAAGSSDQAHILINKGTLPALVRLLETSENDEILEQSVWIMGNLAGESAPSRDAVIGAGVLRPIINCLNRKPNLVTLLKIGAWTLSNICDGQPRHLLDLTHLGPLLDKLLQQTDEEVLSHTCWALSHLCDGPPAHLRSLLALIPQLCFRLVTLLSHASHKIVKPALRTIGNIVCAEDDVDYTDLVTGADAVFFLADLVTTSPSKDIQKEACWTLSNIAAGTFPQIQTVLDSGVLLHIVALATSGNNKGGDSSIRVDAEVRSEAAWVILNASSCGSDAQIEQLVDYGSIVVLNGLLPDPSMRLMALEGIERILALGERFVRTGYSPGGSLALSEHSGGPAPRNTAGYCACCSNAAARHTKVLTAARNNTLPQLKDRSTGDSPPVLCSVSKSNAGTDRSHLAIEDEKQSRNESDTEENVTSGEVVTHNRSSKGEREGRVNPFAAQLSVRNLQMMSNACKSVHITKRVTKIFKDHFLSCALCREFFSKHTAEVAYCDECKGHVCSKCDCSKYHLSYQELMWNDIEGSTTGTNGSKKSKKKNKNKKKKNKGTSSSNGSGDVDESVEVFTEKEQERKVEKVEEVEKEGDRSDSGSESDEDLAQLVVPTASTTSKKSKKQKKKEKEREKKAKTAAEKQIAASTVPPALLVTPPVDGLVSLADYSDLDGRELEVAFTAVEGRRRGKHGSGASATASAPFPSSQPLTSHQKASVGGVIPDGVASSVAGAGVTVVRNRVANPGSGPGNGHGSHTNSGSGSGGVNAVGKTHAPSRSSSSSSGSIDVKAAAPGSSTSYAAALGNGGANKTNSPPTTISASTSSDRVGCGLPNSSIATTTTSVGTDRGHEVNGSAILHAAASGRSVRVSGMTSAGLRVGSAMTMPTQTPPVPQQNRDHIGSNPPSTSADSMGHALLPHSSHFGFPQQQPPRQRKSPPGLGSLGLSMGNLDLDMGFGQYGGSGGGVMMSGQEGATQPQLDASVSMGLDIGLGLDMNMNLSELLGGLGDMVLSSPVAAQRQPPGTSRVLGHKMPAPVEHPVMGVAEGGLNGLGGLQGLGLGGGRGGLVEEGLSLHCDSISISQAEALLRDDDDDT